MHKNKTAISRRKFNKLSTMAIGALPFTGLGNSFFSKGIESKNDLSVHLFSKHLQFLDYNEMSEATAEMGFDGLDLTVRPKGHVLPERVSEDLPKAISAMKKYGLNSQMMTTNVWNPNNSEQKLVLETASKFGISHYRTDWLKYPENKTIQESQVIFGRQAEALEQLNKVLGLIGYYQNHSGKHVGAPIWDLPPILSATKNENFGCQYDIRHAVVEGGGSWELGLRLISPYIKSIVVKDFKWGIVNGKWKPINTPLGEGMVDFKHYFSLLRKYKINVPVSLHLEYDLGGAEHGVSKINIDKKVVFAKMIKDLNFIKNTWEEVE